MDTKKCPYCGKTILAIAKSCKYCGESLEQETPVQEQENTTPEEEIVEQEVTPPEPEIVEPKEEPTPPEPKEKIVDPPKENPAKKNQTIIIAAAVGGVILLAVVAYLVWTFVINKKTTDNESNIVKTEEVVQTENTESESVGTEEVTTTNVESSETTDQPQPEAQPVEEPTATIEVVQPEPVNPPQNEKGFSYIDIPAGSTAEYILRIKQQDGTTKDYVVSDLLKRKGSIVNNELNVLYLGYNNTISVNISGVRPETVTCKIKSGSASTPVRSGSVAGNATFKINPSSLGDITVVAESSDGGRAEATFKVKELPTPMITLGGQSKPKTMLKSAILSAGRLETTLSKDFLLAGNQFSYTITEYTLQYPRVGGGISQEVVQGNGGAFNKKVKEIIEGTTTFSVLSFVDIKVKGPDGRIKEGLNNISIVVY